MSNTAKCTALLILSKPEAAPSQMDELIRVDDGDPMPFHWHLGDKLPKPEDFVLECSGTTLEDIYKVAEWESQRPHMPAPMVMDGGPVQPLSQTGPRCPVAQRSHWPCAKRVMLPAHGRRSDANIERLWKRSGISWNTVRSSVLRILWLYLTSALGHSCRRKSTSGKTGFPHGDFENTNFTSPRAPSR